jgi:pSer/pThr/pTyr-binding forkhead associated (FHA) protein
MAFLYEIREDGLPGSCWPLEANSLVVGRGEVADIPVNDASLSRAHFLLVRKAQGFFVIDLKSENGTWIEGRRVNGQRLVPGQVIRAGQSLFYFSDQPLPERSRTARPRNVFDTSVGLRDVLDTMKSLVTAVCVCVLAFAPIGSAQAVDYDQPLSIAADVLVVRPACLVATVVGSALFVVALPFAAPSKSIKRTAKALVAAPAKATFTRPLGDMEMLVEGY